MNWLTSPPQVPASPLNGSLTPHEWGEAARWPVPQAGSHILIPVGPKSRHRQDALAALQLAALHRHHPRVTLLHVLRPLPQAEERSFHWLSAIDRLHRTLANPVSASKSQLAQARAELTSWVESAVPVWLRNALILRGECRLGAPAPEIARFADEQAVDLVMLCRRTRRRWLPWPRHTERILGAINRPVLLVPAGGPLPRPAPGVPLATPKPA